MADLVGSRFSWRVVDMVTAAILGVALGLVYVLWNQVGFLGFIALDALTPGVGGLVSGVWWMGGPMGALLIRKPGAAIFTETLAASVSMALGAQWGIETFFAGMLQGLGAEVAFAIFAYKLFTPAVAALSGGLSAVAAMVLEGFTHGNFAKELVFQVTYWSTSILSGVVIAGLGSYAIVRSLAKAGVLNRFAAGREMRGRT